MPPLLRTVAVAVSVLSAMGGCFTAPATEQPFRPRWQALSLPAPAGSAGRIMVRDLVGCAGRWFVVGGVVGGAGDIRPAAWSSVDGLTWTPLEVHGTSYYGRQNVLYSAGCRDGRVAAIGAMVGGAHGNPRVSTWTQADEGRLVEVTAPFERFGGPQAVNVGRMTGGPSGWLIVGNRSSGAAVWVSPDSVNFDLVERAPELASDERGRTLAFDAVTVPDGWLVVGSVRQGGRTVPAAWMSSDGRSWRRVTVPAAGSYGQLHRVALVNAHPVAVGPRTGGFGAWRDVEAGWEVAGDFGAVQGSAPPSVRGLVVVDDRLVATISTGTAYELWLSGDEGSTWQRVVGPPVTVPVGGDTAVAATAVGRRLLVAVDGGTGAGLWLTQEPLPG